MRVRLGSIAASVILLAWSPPVFAADTLGRIETAGMLNIGYRVDARPFSYRAASGEPAGYIVEICRDVADEIRQSLGSARVAVNFVPVTAQGRFAAVRDGSVDMVCDPSSVTMGRRETVDFSLPTFVDGAGLLYRGRDELLRFEDLRGKRVGVIAGTTTESLLRNAISGVDIKATISTVPDYAAGLDHLLDQSLDAFMGDRSILVSLLTERGQGSGLRLSKSYFSYELYALVLPKDDDRFRLVVDRTLARLYRSGRIEALLKRTFGDINDDPILRDLRIFNAVPE